MPKPMQTYGRLAFEAYAETAGGKSLVTGDELPKWEHLTAAVREAWEAAGRAVADGVVRTGAVPSDEEIHWRPVHDDLKFLGGGDNAL